MILCEKKHLHLLTTFVVSVFAVTIALLCSTCSASKNGAEGRDTLFAESFRAFGRVRENESGRMEMISSGAHIGFTFTGTECRLYASVKNVNSHNYLQYELDGVYQKRIRINSDRREPLVITAGSNGTHTVWVYKATEAHTGPVFVEKITGTNIRSIQRPEAPLIEFIGNSITCGAAADPSEIACGAGAYHDQHNAFHSYGPRVARALNANFILSSVSGIGIYRNWNSDGPAMPQVYEKADFQFDSGESWDFSKYKPKIVSIALGTNDLSNGDGKRERSQFDSAAFVNNYIRFVQLVRSKYRAVQIVLLSSPMINGDRRIKLQNCLTAVKQSIDRQSTGDKPLQVFFFKPMKARGCTGHPSVDDHEIIAEEITPFFRNLLR